MREKAESREKERAKKELNQLLTPTKTTTYPLSETMKSLEKELNQDIFSNDKDLKKEKKNTARRKLKREIF